MDSILNEMRQLHNQKNSDYGNSFEQTLNEFGLTALAVRLNDKTNRAKVLIKTGTQHVTNESLRDTLIDLACYAVMGIKWIDNNDISRYKAN